MPPTLPTDVDHRVTTALDSRDAGQVKSSGDARKSVSLLLRKVYALLLLRNLAVTVSECLAIFDESVSAFFAGTTGLVIAAMIWLVQMIVAAFACASDRLAPGDPFNRHRFTGLVALECVVCAGAATNLYHSYEMHLADVVTANAALGAFQLGHVLFFFNPWLDYNALYGLLYGVAVVASVLTVNWTYDRGEAWTWTTTAGAVASCAGCAWYSLETHALVARKRLRAPADCFFVIVCFSYADVWHALSKCTLGGATGSSGGAATKTGAH